MDMTGNGMFYKHDDYKSKPKSKNTQSADLAKDMNTGFTYSVNGKVEIKVSIIGGIEAISAEKLKALLFSATEEFFTNICLEKGENV